MKIKLIILIAGLAIILALTASQVPQTNSYDLSWHVIAGGGGSSQSNTGQFSLYGTIGQAETSLLTGGTYSLQGGFWVSPSSSTGIFLPLIEK